MKTLIQNRKVVAAAVHLPAAVCLLVAIGIAAQLPPGQAGMVAQSALAAHGSRWASGDILDWIAEGRLTFFEMNAPKATFDMTLLRKGGAKVQRVIKQPAGDLKQGSDGTKSWESISGFYLPAAQGRTLHFIESQTLRSPQRLFNYQTEGLALRDLGSNGKAHVIEAEDRQGKKTTYHVNLDTSTIGKLEFVVGESRHAFGGRAAPVTDTYVFSDYRMVQGALTAFKIERFMDGTKIEEMVFSAVRYNEGLRDQDFRR